MKSLRALQIHVEHAAQRARICNVEDCCRTTREGKDFCSKHVELHPYIQDLIDRIETRAEEDLLVKRKGSKVVNLQGITAQEIILCLRRGGTRTEERLQRELQIDKAIIHNYLIRLSAEGMVVFGRTQRNNLSVRLTDHDPSLEIDEEDND